MQSLMEQSNEGEDIKIHIHCCYTCGEANSTETLLKHPKNNCLVTFHASLIQTDPGKYKHRSLYLLLD
jgi:hypothetical protein